MTCLVQSIREELERMREDRDKAVDEVAQLDEALAAVQNGPNVELMQAWDTERRELLQDLEAAENRVLSMQTQVCVLFDLTCELKRMIVACFGGLEQGFCIRTHAVYQSQYTCLQTVKEKTCCRSQRQTQSYTS
jgi:hypothetical protein